MFNINIRTLFDHEGTTQSLVFTPDSQYLISGCTLEVIRVWHVKNLLDTTSDEVITSNATFDNAHDLGITSMDVSNVIKTDGINVTVFKGHSIKLKYLSFRGRSFNEMLYVSIEW